MSIWGILVAGGSGSRFGRAKQFEYIGEKPVIQWSLDRLQAATDGVVVVLPEGEVEKWSGGQIAVTGGATRSASVRAGLSQIPDDAEVVLIHDAARPLASTELANSVAKAVLDGADAAIPGIPVSDTIKRVKLGTSPLRIIETVDRTELYAVQTPQAFRTETLRRAHAGEPDASDDAALVERVGGTVVIVPGEARNMKITVAEDMAVARVLIQQ